MPKSQNTAQNQSTQESTLLHSCTLDEMHEMKVAYFANYERKLNVEEELYQNITGSAKCSPLKINKLLFWLTKYHGTWSNFNIHCNNEPVNLM